MIIFLNFGGWFGFSVEECKDIVYGVRRVLAYYSLILLSLGGGMMFDKVKVMMEMYG